MAETLQPGSVVLVTSPEGDWIEAFGTRTLGGSDPVTVEDYFRIGSVTKTMTGTVILQLVQEGALELDDPVSTFWPDIPNGDTITIAQLLGMRSGLFNYTKTEELNRAMDDEQARAWTPEELLALGIGEPVDFAPGESFEYSNTNTVLAGLIAEKITGKDIATLLSERIFAPLELEHTLMPAITDGAIPEPHPRGYMFGTNLSTLATSAELDNALPEDQQAAAMAGELEPNDYTDLNPSWAGAAGAAISTASDLAMYAEALVSGGLLDPDVQQQRIDSVETVDPAKPAGPGYGLALANFGPMYGHTGGFLGFQTFAGHDPERDMTIVVLTNLQYSPDGSEPANVITQELIRILYAEPSATVDDDAVDED